MTPDIGPQRIIVAITGASGAIFGVRVLQRIRELDVESHLLLSSWGGRTLEHETDFTVSSVRELADVVHKPGDQAASVSSGSFITNGMIIAPCSMKTLAAISSGYADDLITRAADVVIKERRRLVLIVRESPLSVIHLENMLKLARLGVIIVPPVPAFYNHPKTVDDMVDYIVIRALDQLGFPSASTSRWKGGLSTGNRSRENGGE